MHIIKIMRLVKYQPSFPTDIEMGKGPRLTAGDRGGLIQLAICDDLERESARDYSRAMQIIGELGHLASDLAYEYREAISGL